MSQTINDDPFNEEQAEAADGGDFLVVGLGASAGGIGALRDFFAHVPADSGMAYVVILHLSPEHESRLAEVLQQTAPIPVVRVREQVRVEPDRVYVVSPNQRLTLEDGQLSVSEIKTVEERRAPVDIFFRTLAESHRTHAVCVILSGTGPNGSMGLRRVKERGGVAFVQDPREAEFSDMPRNSLATGLVDFALPAAEIPAKIIGYRDSLGFVQMPTEPEERPEGDELALREIFTQLRVRTGHDFVNYKRSTVLRRIGRRMGVNELSDLPSYARFVMEHPQEVKALLGDLLISVTNFFRDPAAFERLEGAVIPRLFEGKGAEDQVRVWVAGCATGEEAYSVAMMLSDFAAGMDGAPQIQVFATDIDENAIATGREGWYTESDVADVLPARLSRYFYKDLDGYRVRREIREHVLFAVHNVIKDPPFAHLDLVTCRNLLIYLNRAAQQRVLEVLQFSLNPGGYLMLGTSESADNAGDLFVPVDKEQRIYQSRAIAGRLMLPIPEPTLALRLGKLPGPRHVREEAAPERYSYAGLHQRLLEAYAPPSVVINEEYDILHMSDSAGRYLEFRGGDPSYNLLKLVRPELRLKLRSALYHATQKREAVETHGVGLRVGDEMKLVCMKVRPVMRDDEGARGFILIIFDEERTATEAEMSTSADGDEPIAHQLEEELTRVKSQLSATIEQHELQKEELKASNEELHAMNEELRSAAEELETSREELQSINEELSTVNQELKIRIEELSHTREDFRNLMNSTDVGTVFLDRQLRIKLFTPRARDIFNLIPSDIGRPFGDISTKLVGEDLAADLRQVLEGLETIERVVETAEGGVFFMRLLPYSTSEGGVEGASLTFTDISQRLKVEEELHRSQAQLSALVNQATVGIARSRLDGSLLFVNRRFCEMLGYDEAELAGRTILELTHPDDFAENAKLFGRLASSGDPFQLEKRLVRKDGTAIWASVSVSPIRGASGGAQSAVAIVADVTERHRAEELLRETLSQMQMATDATRAGWVTWDLKTGESRWDERGRAIVGFANGDEARTAEGWLRRFHPEDRPAGEEHLARCLAEDRDFDMEYRVVRADGQTRWVHAKGRFRRAGDGTPLTGTGLVIDVTERRQGEDALRWEEKRLREAMERVTDFAIIMLDSRGHIESWNAGAERIFGFEVDEALGRHAEIIFTREDRKRGVPEEEMRQAREEGRATDERWHLRKDGSRIFLSGVLSPVGDGTVTGYVKIARDLTEMKRSEEDLRRAHEEMEDNVRSRTMELALANESLRDEISERIQTERSRVRLLRQIVRAQEDERRRIARDIHDQLGQQMTALRLSLDSLHQDCGETEGTRRKLEQTQSLAERLDADVDFLAWELRPAALDDLGLLAAIGNFVREWSRHTGIPAEFHTTGMEGERLAPEAESALYRITQEALNNAQKYARATSVDVLLERRDRQVVLIVEDNGVGFDPGNDVREGQGLGLVGMRERATLVGGTLEIESTPGEGTAVFARVPVSFLEGEDE